MHIPDGYLSPATCATLYTILRRLVGRAAPHEARAQYPHGAASLVFAAFSFIIMTFNLPLPGENHRARVGVGIAAINWDSWASILAISIALIIQALLFGDDDGGITAIGANCFNMAILGSLSAYGIYRRLAGYAPDRIAAPRDGRAIAGYVAINLSALAAALELGIQPAALSRCRGCRALRSVSVGDRAATSDDGGTSHGGRSGGNGGLWRSGRLPPAHGTDLLRATAPGAQERDDGGWRATKPLWIGLAVLAILTPLGIPRGRGPRGVSGR